MDWIALNNITQLGGIKNATGCSVIFKHSTRCSVSMIAKRKFEMDWKLLSTEMPLYFLDLLNYRDISNAIAEQFQVHHESPQLLLIKDGECIYEASHNEISAEEAVRKIA